MRISLSPQRADRSLTAVRQGNTLVLDGQSYDLMALTESGPVTGADVEPASLALVTARRDGADIHVVLCVPVGPDFDQSETPLEDLIDPPDGPLLIAGNAEG